MSMYCVRIQTYVIKTFLKSKGMINTKVKVVVASGGERGRVGRIPGSLSEVSNILALNAGREFTCVCYYALYV